MKCRQVFSFSVSQKWSERVSSRNWSLWCSHYAYHRFYYSSVMQTWWNINHAATQWPYRDTIFMPTLITSLLGCEHGKEGIYSIWLLQIEDSKMTCGIITNYKRKYGMIIWSSRFITISFICFLFSVQGLVYA